MLSVEEVLETLRNPKPELTNRYKVQEIGLFGSFVRQEQGVESDIDLLVEFGAEADLLCSILLAANEPSRYSG